MTAVSSSGRFDKSLSTDSTLVVLLPFVPLHVHSQARRLHEHLRAAGALELFHTTVHSLVVLSGNPISETFVTADSALEWFLSSVQGEVAFQLLFLVELLLAMITGEHFCWYLMFVPYVRFQQGRCDISSVTVPAFKIFVSVVSFLVKPQRISIFEPLWTKETKKVFVLGMLYTMNFQS